MYTNIVDIGWQSNIEAIIMKNTKKIDNVVSK